MYVRARVCAMSSELLVDVGDDSATAQLGQLKLTTIEDQQWPADESFLSKSGERDVCTHQLMMSCLQTKDCKSPLRERDSDWLGLILKCYIQTHILNMKGFMVMCYYCLVFMY